MAKLIIVLAVDKFKIGGTAYDHQTCAKQTATVGKASIERTAKATGLPPLGKIGKIGDTLRISPWGTAVMD